MHGHKASVALAASLAAAAALGPGAIAHAFNVTNLTSDGSVPAAWTDPKLINAWGITYGVTPMGPTPFWISDNNSGFSTVYKGDGTPLPLTVTIPGFGGPGAPTGIVFNGTGGFNVSSGNKSGSSFFLWDTEDGTIDGWNPTVSPTTAIQAVNNHVPGGGSVFKGLTMASIGSSNYLYAADFRQGQIDMYNSSFGLVNNFTDPNVKAGYAPFDVRELNGDLYVTFALQNAAKHDDVAGPGNGYVDVFSNNGTFLRRLVSQGGQVNSPWGLDIAPAGFGKFGGDLLVGNFGDGTISVFNPLTGAFLGVLDGPNGQPIVEGDLWGLINGGGGVAGNPNAVYFTSGVMDEAHGLFGSISVPEPTTWTLMLLGFGSAGAALRRSRVGLRRA
ncbi:MAG: TIGR03118 family protein [Caulobacteraceae bacterium]|nr:TIGR03118 family protein [Caulobacteraceae bacterium]